MAEPKVTLGGVTLGKATVTRKHVRRGQDTEKKSRVQTTVTGGDTKDKQVMNTPEHCWVEGLTNWYYFMINQISIAAIYT